MVDHKQEIKDTRLKGLGSSDAKMVASVGRTGQLNETARKRIAEMLGLKEREDATTYAMQKGNEIEEAIFQAIKSKAPAAVSNPFHCSNILSEKFGFGVFNHIDIEFDYYRSITWWEVKSTIKSAEETKQEYIYQLAWHWMLLIEKSIDSTLYFTHYDTSDGNTQFDAKNITNLKVSGRELSPYIEEIMTGLGIISDSLENFTYDPEIKSDGALLPIKTQEILPKINNLLRMAKDAEERAEQFKQELKKAMEDAGIKSIDNDYFKATFIHEGVAAKFDSKSLQKYEPELYKKYLKNSTVKSQLKLTLK